ncbi:sensor histidine kinase [Microbacterium sp. SLBN-146]|uniref:sensor histidine kinase n=1 Tax=Microbacterium sp. SLBN-146 TaxID=2768457 RepID=UPI00114FCD3F|nr:histidine kinase [Microbacterium sp. SLBN-146]TQJ32005.1 signal transduction histidine kinase [Microbacterium sp. SLBN-146]
MATQQQVVVGSATRTDDDLLLPRPPGVLRRFWAAHPRTTDAIVAVAGLIVSAPALVLRSDIASQPAITQVWFAAALMAVACAALLLRRTHPRAVFVVVLLPSLLLPASLSPIGHLLLGFAVYALAVYRSTRACWVAAGIGTVLVTAHAVVSAVTGAESVGYLSSVVVGAVIPLLIGALIGINVGGRRRYLEALIERSRQLAIERDQQAQLAAAAERTRIAREMHDIVSHSLTVIVALSEGASAAADPAHARQANHAAAETARTALHDMRAMLGVLRDSSDELSPLEPLQPVDPGEIVATAQRAGYPVTLQLAGDLDRVPRSARFAVGRIVQEGVTNAMRHAPRAREIGVRVLVAESDLRVIVDNDGTTMASPAARPGFGLRGLHERVGHVGGTLDVGPRADGGWSLSAEIPFAPVPREEEA